MCVGEREGFAPVGRMELIWNPSILASQAFLSFWQPGWTSDQMGYSSLEGRRCSLGGCKQGTLIRL